MFFLAYAISRNEMRRSIQGALATDPTSYERRPPRRRGPRTGA
jgi:hypothetical protein